MNPWRFALSVESDFRGTYGKLDYVWYGPNVTNFEAVETLQTGGVIAQPRIRVYANSELVGTFFDRANAEAEARAIYNRRPAACSVLFEAHFDIILRTINGR